MLDRHVAAKAPHRGRPPPMAATPAAPISPQLRPAALPMSPFTKSAASPSSTWSKARGCTAGCATSAPGRGRHLLLQALLWRRTLHLARPRPFQGLHLVRRGGPQPGLVRAPQTGIDPASPPVAAIDHISLTRAARNAIIFLMPTTRARTAAGSLRTRSDPLCFAAEK
jgi:hypothetical protein